ncbi:DUF177 domain-containing protein [Candidatus Peregrinibacteria bacterium]|nr:DUF177 domain-containing protein [Candidatus Peregrinibacteria bacterium]
MYTFDVRNVINQATGYKDTHTVDLPLAFPEVRNFTEVKDFPQTEDFTEIKNFSETKDFSQTDDFSKTKEIFAVSPMHLEVSFRKLPDGINAEVEKLQVSLQFPCSRCITPYVLSLDIKPFEACFYINAPQEILDEAGIFFIDKKRLTVDLSDMLRQEILLHFPLVPLCSKSCKGLCVTCGKNRNHTKCRCTHKSVTSSDSQQPFQNIKNLISGY